MAAAQHHHHHHFNYAASIPTTASASDHLNMLGLRDVVFIAPPSSLHQQNQQVSSAAVDHPHHHLPSSTALGVGVSIFPLLTATPCIASSSAVEVIGNDQPGSNFLRSRDDPNFGKKDGIGIEAEKLDESGNGANNLRVCRDCGNRAKKECGFRRCRTCCKSRGYDCATHVKSTWVPASKRRERQVAMVGISFGGGGVSGGGGSSGSSSGGPKKQRVEFGSSQNPPTNVSSTSNSATPRSFDTSPFRQDASFKQSLPCQVRAPANFRCIRVTAISEEANEFAYQATVTISGHVFKGFLYDQGSGGKNSITCISQLRLEEGNSLRNRDSSPIVNPTDAFAASGCRRLLEGEG